MPQPRSSWRTSLRSVCWLIPSVVFLLFAACNRPRQTASESRQVETIDGVGGPVEVEVATDQVGIHTREGIERSELDRLARENDLKPEADFPPGIHTFQLARPMSRQAVAELALSLKRNFPNVVQQAGLVLTPKGSNVPMLLTDELVVQYKEGTKKEDIDRLNVGRGTQVVMVNPFVKTQFLLRTMAPEPDAIALARAFERDPNVQFAHPNWVIVHFDRWVPNDPLYPNQWHHNNTGASGGTRDADIDTQEAWDISRGDAATIIAVIEDGFDVAHADLTPNLWTNPGEIAADGVDNDGNGFIDDINGWDFLNNDATLAGGSHGTCVAGCAAARGNNALGVAGSCPNCRIMLIRYGSNVFQDGLAFGYAQNQGAQIITNSWGFAPGTPIAAALSTAINNAANAGRGGLGAVIFWAMNNIANNDCAPATLDISSLPFVIAVSSFTNQDKFYSGGFGNCMDLLGPTDGGTLWIATTDVTGNAGYNNAAAGPGCPSADLAPPPANARDYTLCFNGTSAATPIVAGVGGLILSVNPALTRAQVQQVLQDTTDRIEDSQGAYSPTTGFSSPASGNATHGYGRVNAFEALRLIATAAMRGRNGTDVYLRDNRLDWGNTEQRSNVLFEPVRGFIPHWHSEDIKVDAPPFAPTPVTSAAFDAFVHENPIEKTTNRVYVRVHNRGPAPATTTTVKLHWAFAGTALPALPTDFWTAFPADSADTSKWHPLPAQTVAALGYSGSSVAGGAADASQILQFDFDAPAVDETQPNPRHYCLLGIVDSPQDPVSAASKSSLIVDDITPSDNNVTHRNVALQDSTRSRSFEERFFVRNPLREEVRVVLRIDKPAGWEASLDKFAVDKPFSLKPGEETLVTLKVDARKERQVGSVSVTQVRLDSNRPMGGIVFEFAPRARK